MAGEVGVGERQQGCGRGPWRRTLAAWQQEGRQARSSGAGKFPGGLVIRILGFHYRGRVQSLVRELKFPLKKKKKKKQQWDCRAVPSSPLGIGAGS